MRVCYGCTSLQRTRRTAGRGASTSVFLAQALVRTTRPAESGNTEKRGGTEDGKHEGWEIEEVK